MILIKKFKDLKAEKEKKISDLEKKIRDVKSEKEKLISDRMLLAQEFLKVDGELDDLHDVHIEDRIHIRLLRDELEVLKKEKFSNLLQKVARPKCKNLFFYGSYFYLFFSHLPDFSEAFLSQKSGRES